MTACVPEWNGFQVGRVLPCGPGINLDQLPRVVLDQGSVGFSVLDDLRGLGLSQGGHVVGLAILLGLLEAVEVDGMDVVHAIRQLLRYFLKEQIN